MNITFANRELEKLSKDYKKCQRKMGDIRAKQFIQRLNAPNDAQTLEDVRHLPGKFHELVRDRKGQWACDLDQPHRLIFIPHEEPIPTNEDGQYVWVEIHGVEVVEIINYH